MTITKNVDVEKIINMIRTVRYFWLLCEPKPYSKKKTIKESVD